MPARLSSLSLALALALLAAAGAPPTVAQQLAPPLEFAAPPPASNGGVLLPLASAPAEESPFGVAALAPSESAVGLEAPQAGSAAAPAGPAPAEAGPDLIWGETGQGASSEQDLLTAAAAGLAAGAGAGAGAPLPEGAAAPTAPLRSNFSSLISLLSPPPGFKPPPLTPQQQANLPRLRQMYQGIGTVSVQRDVGSFGAARLACSMGYLNEHFSKHLMALPAPLFGDGELCGACVRMFCVDSVCEDALVRNATFMIVDSCRECNGTDLLVSAAGLAALSSVDVDISPKLQVAWAPDSCAPLIQDGIRMLASPDNRANYLSFNFSNLRQLLKAVSIGGLDFQRTSHGTWQLDTEKDIPLRPPYELVLVGAGGQRLVKRLQSLRSQDLGVNFG